mgnify:CR=1 FL=1
MNDYWCIPSKEDADFVPAWKMSLMFMNSHMTDVPVVCMDEKPYQLFGWM